AAWHTLLWIVASVALLVVAWSGFVAFQDERRRSAESEEAIARSAIENANFSSAKEHLLKAEKDWKWNDAWERARQARERALDEEGMKKQAAVFRAQRDE